MIDIEDILKLCLPFVLMFAVIFIYNTSAKEQEKKLEILKNTKDYQIYDECHLFDDKYYCYNLEEVKD